MLFGGIFIFYELLFCINAKVENGTSRLSRIKRAGKPPYRLSPGDNSILHERCGDLPRWRGVSDKAIGGIPTNTREAPWSVSLQYTDDVGGNFLCSGTLISDKHVLTAAHCVVQYEMRTDNNGVQKIVEIVREPGRFKFSFDDDCGKHYVQNCVMRPLFTRYGLRAYVPKGFRAERDDMSMYDIAVFEMDEKIDINKRNYVIPACLQGLPVIDDDVFWMFGYGSSSYDPNLSNSGPLLSSTTTAVDCVKNGEKRLGADNFCTKSTQHPCRTVVFKQRTDVNGATKICNEMGGSISPVRYAKEFGAIKLAMNAAQVRRRPDRRILVGGKIDESGVNYKWTYDWSPVSTEITTWVPGRGPGNKFTPGSRCLTLGWYDPLNAGAPPSKLGYTDIACYSKDAAGVVCMKAPVG